MKRLVIAKLAQADVRDIKRYTGERWGVEQKNRYISAIRARLSALREHSEIGRLRPEYGDSYRSLIIGAHIAIYRVTNNDVIVVRVLHQAMDIRRHL